MDRTFEKDEVVCSPIYLLEAIRHKSQKTFNMILIPQNQFEIVIPFLLFIATHMKIRTGTAINRPFTFINPVIRDRRSNLKPTFLVERRNTFFSRPHHEDPMPINLQNFVFWDKRRFLPLLFLQSRFSTNRFGNRWFIHSFSIYLSSSCFPPPLSQARGSCFVSTLVFV